MSNLIRIKHPLSNFNYHLSGANIANINKIHRTVSEQQLFKKMELRNRSFQSAAEVGPVLNESSPCQEIPPTTFWHCNPYSALLSILFVKTLISILSSLVKTIAFYVNQTRHKNVNDITWLLATLRAVSKLIGIFQIGKFCFWVQFFKRLLLINSAMDFVEICNVCARKAIIKAAERMFNSDKIWRSCCDLYFGVTFFGTQCRWFCFESNSSSQ